MSLPATDLLGIYVPFVYGLLHRLGYSSLVPRPQQPQADPAAEEEFRKTFGERLDQIQTQYPDRRLQVFHEDEARLGQQRTLTRVWARTGSRPRTVRQTQYSFVYVLAATCPETGQAEGPIAARPADRESVPRPVVGDVGI